MPAVEPSPLPFDRAAALRNLENNEDLLKEIAAIYLDDIGGELDAMRLAVRQGDMETLFRVAHTLKGTLSTFCADEAFDAASQIVHLTRAGDRDAAARQLAVLIPLAEELAAALQRELG